MPYRRTENVVRRLAEREEAILAAATAIAAEGGMAAVQIAAVAARAGIAAGTVYRYFPSKTDLVADLVAAVAGRELSAMTAAGDAAPGPLSALAACIATFCRPRAERAAAGLGGDRRAGRRASGCGPRSISASRSPPNWKRASRPQSRAAICPSRTLASPPRPSSAH